MDEVEKNKYRAIQKNFSKTYRSATGTIEGEDDLPVTLSLNVLSFNNWRPGEYGCPPGEIALLVNWIPAGLTKEDEIDLRKIAPMTNWVVFPREFEGLPVYYKRGSLIIAQ